MKLTAVQGLLRSIALAAEGLRGQPMRRRTRDRALLERHILPAYARRADVRRVLFVGCARYTEHYARVFDHVDYWTIDPLPRNRRWGASHHIRDRLEHLARHVPAGHFDAIVCNGVLGWGLNRRADIEAAFAACHDALRVGGELVLGWNDVFPHNAVPPDRVLALRRYARCSVHGLGGPVVRIDVPHRHVFEFYRRVEPEAAQADNVVGASGPGAQADSGLQAPLTQSS